jgi:purine-binding chemotaxis protein CheW
VIQVAEPLTTAPNQIVVFKLGEEEYGVDIASVESIIRREALTPVPYAPPSMVGVINLRGRIVPVVDLAVRFELPPLEPTPLSRIVIAQIDGQLIGLAVDAAMEVRTLEPGSVDAPPDVVSSEEMREAILGVARFDDRLVVLIRVEKVVPSAEELSMACEEAG